jgi:hypothetical protein
MILSKCLNLLRCITLIGYRIHHTLRRYKAFLVRESHMTRPTRIEPGSGLARLSCNTQIFLSFYVLARHVVLAQMVARAHV